MRESDRDAFSELINSVYAFYGRDSSSFAVDVWWTAMRAFDLAAVRQALGRHTMNPDAGQFVPKPADVVRMLGGSTQDAAMVAWSKVERALRHVGTYQSVVFDDPLIHRVLDDMGGWVKLGTVTEDELPFRAKEFETRYRGFRMRSELPAFPAVMIGIAQSHNEQGGHQVAAPLLIGDPDRAARVRLKGAREPILRITSAATLAAQFVIEAEKDAA